MFSVSPTQSSGVPSLDLSGEKLSPNCSIETRAQTPNLKLFEDLGNYDTVALLGSQSTGFDVRNLPYVETVAIEALLGGGWRFGFSS